MNRWLLISIILIAVIGFIDSGYLAWGYYSGTQLKCSVLEGCNEVLNSPYSHIGNIPLALLGMIYYGLVIFLLAVYLVEGARFALQAALVLVMAGVLFSAYFIYLQLAVINAICIYCMASAADTLILAILLPLFLYKLR